MTQKRKHLSEYFQKNLSVGFKKWEHPWPRKTCGSCRSLRNNLCLLFRVPSLCTFRHILHSQRQTLSFRMGSKDLSTEGRALEVPKDGADQDLLGREKVPIVQTLSLESCAFLHKILGKRKESQRQRLQHICSCPFYRQKENVNNSNFAECLSFF
ncbi:hypothetical protein LAU_0007 [Lausannevirus]|uniref:Uncharacterized protein n=1 Tax=Lausannevirus TaxID=999883 RepID=F2WKU0_9VIRU|nr:hypothetical protein LAU_0007 [Lausannevirus]AEA06863.1 hypothetical protein LAU_0007 [Lausannevirus]